MPDFEIVQSDAAEALRGMDAGSVHCCVTSPPYWGLRDYGEADQLGLEPTPDLYVERMVEVFAEVRRVLRDDGTLWLNLGDSYATGAGAVGDCPGGGSQGDNWKGATTSPNRMPIPGLKPKDLVGIPWRAAFALQADGWYLRSDIIWAKPNPMPESVRDRPTKAHEYIFLLSKSKRYFYDADAIAENGNPSNYRGNPTTRRCPPGKQPQGKMDARRGEIDATTRNKRTVWTVTTKPYAEAHFATFPPKLIEPCVLAGCPEGGTVLDPFCGSGTTGVVALRASRDFLGIELNPEYVTMARHRIQDDGALLNNEVAATP